MLLDPNPLPRWVRARRIGLSLNPMRWLGLDSHFFSVTPPRQTKLRPISPDLSAFTTPAHSSNTNQRVLEGRLVLQNLDIALGWPIEWGRLRDPAVPKAWRLAFHSHGFLKELLLDNDKARAHHTIWQFIQHWMQQFPEPSAVNERDGWEEMATAKRLMVWSELAYLSPPPETLIRDYILSFVKQTRWLQRDFVMEQDVYAWIYKSMALATSGCFFEGPWPDRMRKEGLDFLFYALQCFITADGDILTRTPGHFVELGTQLRALSEWLRLVERDMSERVREAAKTFLDAADGLRHPDGALPLFNATSIDQDVSNRVPWTLDSYLIGPYAVARHSGFTLIFDGGPLTYGEANVFGHNAPLNFELSYGRSRVVSDSGWCTFSGERHRVYRAPDSHNTLTFDGRAAGHFTKKGLVAARQKTLPPRFVKHPQGMWIAAAHCYYKSRGVKKLWRIFFISHDGEFIASIHVGTGRSQKPRMIREFLQLNPSLTPHAFSPTAFGLNAERPLVLQISEGQTCRILARHLSRALHIQAPSTSLEMSRETVLPFANAWVMHTSQKAEIWSVELEDNRVHLSHPALDGGRRVSFTLDA